jgi:hypothetical protein
MKTSWIVLGVVLLGGACSQVLGLKEPTSESELEADARMADGPAADGPMRDGPIGGQSSLWTFTTTTQFPGGFGTAGARIAADTQCDDMYRRTYTTRQCTKVRAVLQVDNTDDTLGRMAINYQIPATLRVLRATDGVKVAEKWADFVNPTMALQEAVTPLGSNVYFWSGKGVSSDLQCTSWTSSANGSFGNAGDANLRSSTWLAAVVLRCDAAPRLLCVCW